jgi:hypothetical protein
MLRRKHIPFGKIIYRASKPGSNLLVTTKGLGLRLNFRKLLSSIKVKPVGNTDEVSFSHGLKPKPIGEGAHGLLFFVTPTQEASFAKKFSRLHDVHRHSAVLKVYRESLPDALRPDGFTQFFANRAIFTFLKKARLKTFNVRPITYYFVSEKLAVRKFINSPTLEELKESFIATGLRRDRLSLALSNRQIFSFARRNKITLGELEALEKELLSVLESGQKTNFNSDLNVVHDPTIKNFFIVGRASDGKLLVEVIDQGRVPIKGLGDTLREGMPFAH